MNKTVELVNQWAEFESKHPNGELDDFCLYYLSKSREKKVSGQLFDGFMPPYSDVVLMKLLDWIIRLQRIYAAAALQKIELKHFEEFAILNAIAKLGEPKKTEAINHTFHELSTGLNIIASLKCQDYITETDDPIDKRSKRVALTATGRQVLQECYSQFTKVSRIILHDMAEEDIDLCILLLRDIERKFSGIWQQHKGKDIDAIYQEVVGEPLQESQA
jgi:DNA-binding MarR family transcriptional regulator